MSSEAAMAGGSASVLRLIACVLALLIVLPTQADPFFVRVYGRTYKVDPRYASDEPKGPKPQEAMKALPSDIARGPGFRPSHEQVLAEVEERLWIARNQLDADLKETAATPEWRNTGVDAKAIKRGGHGIARDRSGAEPLARAADALRPPQSPEPPGQRTATVPGPAGATAWSGLLPAEAVARDRGQLPRSEARSAGRL